jgi:hypothetical protein
MKITVFCDSRTCGVSWDTSCLRVIWNWYTPLRKNLESYSFDFRYAVPLWSSLFPHPSLGGVGIYTSGAKIQLTD